MYRGRRCGAATAMSAYACPFVCFVVICRGVLRGSSLEACSGLKVAVGHPKSRISDFGHPKSNIRSSIGIGGVVVCPRRGHKVGSSIC